MLPRVRIGALALVCVGFGGGPIASRAAAAPTSSNTQEQDLYRVVVVTAPDLADRSALQLALTSQLVELPVDLTLASIPEASATFGEGYRRAGELTQTHGADLVVWFAYEPDQRMFVFLAKPNGGRTLVRELGAEGASSPHTVALLVRSVVEALISGGRIGVEMPAPEPDPPTPQPSAPVRAPSPPTSPEPVRARQINGLLGIAYRPTMWGRGHPLVHALTLAGDLRVGDHVAAIMRVGGGIPFAVQDSLVRVEIVPMMVHIGARGHARLGRWELGGRLGVQVEALRRRPVALDSAVTVGAPSTRVLVAVSPAAALGVWPHPRVRVGLDLGVDAHLRSLALIVAGPDGDRTIAQTANWRPFAALGVAVRLGADNKQPVSKGRAH